MQAAYEKLEEARLYRRRFSGGPARIFIPGVRHTADKTGKQRDDHRCCRARDGQSWHARMEMRGSCFTGSARVASASCMAC